MFESTDWLLEEPDVSDNTKFEVVHPTVVRPKMSTISEAPKEGMFSVSWFFCPLYKMLSFILLC